MSPSQQLRPIEPTNKKLLTIENLVEKSKQARRIPENEFPFGQAISWLTKAEELAIETGENNIESISNAYVDLILVLTTKCQTLALTCGHIVRQHRDLAIAIEAATRRLAGCRRFKDKSTSTLPSAILEASGHAEQVLRMVTRHLDTGVFYTDAELLTRLLSNLDDIRDLVFPLTDKPASDYRSDVLTLELIATVVSNASLSINRFFSFLSEYEKASAYCRFAGLLLRDVDNRNGFVLNQVQRSSLEKALRRAASMLILEDYRESKFFLKQAEQGLKEVTY